MTRHIPSAALMAACIAAAGPAFADLSAQVVWDDVKASIAAADLDLETAGETMEDGVLTIAGAVLSFEDADTFEDQSGEDVSTSTRAEIALGDLVLTEAGGGVDLAVSGSYPVAISASFDGEAPVVTTLTVSQPDLSLRAEEADGGLLYLYAAPEVSITLDEIEGMDGPEEVGADLVMTGLDGTLAVTRAGALRTSEQSLTMDAMTFRLDASSPEDGADPGKADIALAITDVATTARTVSPDGIGLDELPAFLAAGGAVSAAVDWAAGRTAMAVDVPDVAFTYDASSEGGRTAFAIGPDAISQEVTTQGVSMRVTSPDIPLPEISATIDRLSHTLAVPPLAGEAPQPFSMTVLMEGLALPGAIWDLFDPGTILPRDPISMTLDVSGTATLEDDLVSPEAGTPPLLDGLEISGLRIEGAGAGISARGAFEAQEEGVSPAPGVPPVAGQIEIDVQGVEALLDGLAQIGVLPVEQAAFVRGMLGFVARPTGSDSYATTLDFGADGSVSANGIPLQ